MNDLVFVFIGYVLVNFLILIYSLLSSWISNFFPKRPVQFDRKARIEFGIFAEKLYYGELNKHGA